MTIEIMERESLKRSDEETDNLARSAKKYKDSHQVEGDKGDKTHAKIGSYRDKLVGCIPGTFERAFGFDSDMQEDVESDNEDELAQDDNLRVCFSREEKTRGMDCIDLGFDFFLIKFELREDVDYILKGRPWFISQHFLAIRQWEPEFQASTTTLSSVVVWIRLPELPIEFYEHNALLKIGRVIGPVLRIDANTVNGVQRRFARLCVQVNLDKPLVKTIFLGKLKQEGQGSGSHDEQRDGAVKSAAEKTPICQQEVYGDWTLVTQRKPLNKAREKPNDSSLSQMGESSHTSYDRSLSSTRDGVRATGKRKAPFFQLDRMRRDESKGYQSYQNMTSDGKMESRVLGYLPLMSTTWELTPNPWWRFVTDSLAVLPLPPPSSASSGTSSGELLSKKSLTEIEKKEMVMVISVRNILIDKPVECFMMGSLNRVKMIQSAEAKIQVPFSPKCQ
nr:hypothetical protein CFP56_16152 [Quercus suber]